MTALFVVAKIALPDNVVVLDPFWVIPPGAVIVKAPIVQISEFVTVNVFVAAKVTAPPKFTTPPVTAVLPTVVVDPIPARETAPVPALMIKAVDPDALSLVTPAIIIAAPPELAPPFVLSKVILEGEPDVPKITLSLIVIG